MTGNILFTFGGLIVGCIVGYSFYRYVLKSKYQRALADAEKEAEVIKEKKLLEVKEKFLNKKAELEKMSFSDYENLVKRVLEK